MWRVLALSLSFSWVVVVVEVVVVGRFSRHNETTLAVDLGRPRQAPLDRWGWIVAVGLDCWIWGGKKAKHVDIACVMIIKLKGSTGAFGHLGLKQTKRDKSYIFSFHYFNVILGRRRLLQRVPRTTGHSRDHHSFSLLASLSRA